MILDPAHLLRRDAHDPLDFQIEGFPTD